MSSVKAPVICARTRIHPLAMVIGSVTFGDQVFFAPAASVHGDEEQHIYIGNQTNVQIGVVVHGLETFEGDHELPENEVEVDGKKYFVFIRDRVFMAHQSQVHGSAKVGDDTSALPVITKQEQAHALPKITRVYRSLNLNAGVIRVNIQSAEASQPVAISR
jgi:carbonic anhydrase